MQGSGPGSSIPASWSGFWPPGPRRSSSRRKTRRLGAGQEGLYNKLAPIVLGSVTIRPPRIFFPRGIFRGIRFVLHFLPDPEGSRSSLSWMLQAPIESATAVLCRRELQ